MITADSGFTMNYEFNASSQVGVLCGTDFICYRPFQDDPEQVMIEETKFDWGALAGNLLAGLAVVGCVTALAAYAASVVFTGGATAAFAPWVIGGLAGVGGVSALCIQAKNDYQRGTVSGKTDYLKGGAIGSLSGAMAGASFCMVPYAAEVATYSLLPYGMNGIALGNMYVGSQTLVNGAMAAGYSVTFSNIMVKLNDAVEGFTGYNAIGNAIGQKNYQTVKNVSQVGSDLILDMGVANPKLYAKKDNVGNKIKKNAVYDNKKSNHSKITPSSVYDADAKPKGAVTKITDKMDDATKRSLMRENEAAETIARNGYDIEQNPVVEGTSRNPDYKIEGEISDCYSPAENTKIRNIASTIEEKVNKKGQAKRVVLNLADWKGDVDELEKQLKSYPIDGLEEVLVVNNGAVKSIYP